MKPDLSVEIRCPECGDVLHVPIEVTLTHVSERQQRMRCEPDLADVWAHAWTHQSQEDE